MFQNARTNARTLVRPAVLAFLLRGAIMRGMLSGAVKG
jgi:hypothetical protein